MRNRVRHVLVPLTLALLATVTVVSASQAVDSTTLPAIVPSNKTPDIGDGNNFAVKAITKVGNDIVVGGLFTSVTNHGDTTVIPRSNILAFDATTGLVETGFAPTLSDEVDSLLPGPTPGTVYVGGKFNTVNGVTHNKLVELNLSDGSVVSQFAPFNLDGIVNDIVLSGTHLVLGGTFTKVGNIAHAGLATLNPTTGATDPFMNIQLAGHHNSGASQSGVGADKFDLSPDGSKLIVVGNFKTVAVGSGTPVTHDQITMLNMSGASAVPLAFNAPEFTSVCNSGAFDEWVRDVEFSPDGSYFIEVGTGGPFPGTLCDSAARFETADANNTNAHSTWVDHSGGDTFLSVATTSSAIYVGGHIRWLNNSFGKDAPAAGAVGRASIAALDPVSGLPMAWNPGRNPRGFGIQALYVDSGGLYVGSDTDFMGNSQYQRGKIALMPFAGGYTPPAGNVPNTLPLKIYLTAAGQPVSYRTFNGTTGGPLTAAASADGTAWQNARGGFLVDSTLYYGMTNGSLFGRSYDGSTLGTASTVNPFSDPFWDDKSTGGTTGQTYKGNKSGLYFEIPGLTSMYYDGHGKLYYTRAGQNGLFWRWFTPDSAVTGADEFTVAGATGFNTVKGVLFIAGSSLYYSTSDGNLHKIGWTGSTTSGSSSVISGPGVDSINWATGAAFVGK
ncbi:MAG TPA: hypothetical protein VKB69_04510 [Micromonosporaceae bacterium]|nr:hypothetical protein [Micromonosporaceae bacterium]